MPGIRFSILCATLILFQNVKGSWEMNPSSSKSRATEKNAAWQARNFLFYNSQNLENLEDERLEAIKKLHSTSDYSKRQFYQTLAERLGEIHDKIEGEYLKVLKGYPVPGIAEIYAPSSQERYVKQFMETGMPLTPIPVDDTKKVALISPSVLAAPHVPIFKEPKKPMSLQNYVRLRHDCTRVRLENLEKAYKNQAKIRLTRARETPLVRELYENHITMEKRKLEMARGEQKLALIQRIAPKNFEPEERKRTKEIIKEQLAANGLEYERFHGYSHKTEESAVETEGAPSHAPKLRFPENALYPRGDGFVPFRSVNEALERSLDDIDVLTHELSVARANKKRMRNALTQALYGQSIKRLEDRIEIIRRYQDDIASGRMDEIPRTRYIPGSEKKWLKMLFTYNHLNWDQEHAHNG